jgi:hypothetical protein
LLRVRRRGEGSGCGQNETCHPYGNYVRAHDPPFPEKTLSERQLSGAFDRRPRRHWTRILDARSQEGIIYHPLERLTPFEPKANADALG